MTFRTARVALVGDRSPHVRAHVRLPDVLEALRRTEGLDLDAYWIATDDPTAIDTLPGFDAVWLVPGSPYRSQSGAVSAARTAREGGIPFLGTCGGFQHALLDFARNVAGLRDAAHAEYTPDAAEPLIAPLSCSLAGHEAAVRFTPGSLAARVIGAERTVERYLCSYGLDARYLEVLARHGLRFTGVDEEGEARVAELPGHPFFLVTLFQPELAELGPRPHPVLRAFAEAAADRCRRAGSARIS